MAAFRAIHYYYVIIEIHVGNNKNVFICAIARILVCGWLTHRIKITYIQSPHDVHTIILYTSAVFIL